jgi:hypothetical protein
MNNLCLVLFNERVDRLDRCKLTKRMDENPHYKLDYEQMINRRWVSVGGITEDDIDAFVLNIRLLIQDKDGFSIRCLAENVYSRNDVPKNLRDEFNQHRAEWNNHQKSSSMFRHYQEDRNFENSELFDILLYGGLAHSDPGKVKSFYFITKQGIYSSILFAWFLSTLRIFIKVVREIRDVNHKVLEYYNAKEQIK